VEGTPLEEQFAARPVSDVVAERIREVRQHRGLSQRALAGIIESYGDALDAPTISRIEKRSRGVTLDDLLVIAAALNVSPVALLIPRHSFLVAIGRRTLTANVLEAWARGYRPPSFSEEAEEDDAVWERRINEFMAESISPAEAVGLRYVPALATLKQLEDAALVVLLQLVGDVERRDFVEAEALRRLLLAIIDNIEVELRQARAQIKGVR
jgi:transcriptional regulator with XRE-family HTH domain